MILMVFYFKRNLKYLWKYILTCYYFSNKISISNAKYYKHSVYQSLTVSIIDLIFLKELAERGQESLKKKKSAVNSGLYY